MARIQDPGLINAWGVSLSPTGGAIWVSSHGAGTSPLYTGDFTRPDGTLSPFAKAAFTVNIPDGAPTGQVFNTSADFVITNGTQSARSIFIFAGETGSITGWNPAVPPITEARIGFDGDGESRYTGLAIRSATDGNQLYAADLANGRIDVFDSTFTPVVLAEDAFVDPKLPAKFAPFNIQNLGGTLYVTYARTDKGGDIDDLKGGVVSAFDLDGNFLRRIATQGHLDAPWGLALAPTGFGHFGGALLVGNHGDGRINAFDPATGQFLGKLRDELARPIRIDGLFGLAFGNGVSAGDRDALYFAAGPNDGEDGLFGSVRFMSDAPPARGAGPGFTKVAADGLGTSVATPPGRPPARPLAVTLATRARLLRSPAIAPAPATAPGIPVAATPIFAPVEIPAEFRL